MKKFLIVLAILGALAAGATITLNLYPEGDDTGDTFWTGDVIITSISYVRPIQALGAFLAFLSSYFSASFSWALSSGTR